MNIVSQERQLFYRRASTYLGLSVMLIFFTWCMPNKANAEIVVVVNKDTSISSLTMNDVRSIFMGKLFVFPSTSEEARALDLPADSSIRKEFYLNIARKSPRKMNSYWARYLFTGKGRPPEKVKSEELKERMKSTTGFIGYVDSASLDDSMKVVYRLVAAGDR